VVARLKDNSLFLLDNRRVPDGARPARADVLEVALGVALGVAAGAAPSAARGAVELDSG